MLHRKLDETVGRLPPFESQANYAIYLESMRMLYHEFQPVIDWTAKRAGLLEETELVLQVINSDVTTMGASSS